MGFSMGMITCWPSEIGAGREVLGHGLAGARHAATVDETLGHEVLLNEKEREGTREGQREPFGS